MTICQEKDCKKRASFNYKGETKYIYCAKHSLAGMINITYKSCKFQDCNVKPNFNHQGEKKGLYCEKHKEDVMVDVVHKKCKAVGCFIQPSFNYSDQKPEWCEEHKKDNMKNTKDKILCLKCPKIPSFNYENEIKALYCKEHSLSGMINVRGKGNSCKFPGCGISAAFNYKGSKRLYCSQHKEDGMINVVSKRCKKCDKIPKFNYPGNNTGAFCGDHKTDEMVNTTHKKCKLCSKIPSFGVSKTPTHCIDHKKDDMIDVVHNTCLFCDKRSTYGSPGDKLRYCEIHKKEGDVKNPSKKCEGKECVEVALYGLLKRLRCEQHKIETDILLTNRKCENCGRLDILTPDNLCVHFCNLDKHYYTLKKNKKRKEEIIEKLLSEKIDRKLDYKDEIVDRSCSNKRPDFGYDVGTHVVFVEVDEEQHNSYKCKIDGGEDRRMFEIFQSLGGKACIFIRYNPDTFRDNNGNVVKILESRRQDLLVKWILRCLKSIPTTVEDSLRVKYLFYDGWYESDISFRYISEKDVVVSDYIK